MQSQIFGSSKVTGQSNNFNTRSDWNHKHHQLLCFLPFCYATVAFTFKGCLFVGLSAFTFAIRNWACSVGMRTDDWHWHWRISLFFAFKDFLGYVHLFCIIIHLHCNTKSYQFCTSWLHLSREYSPAHFTVLPAAAIGSHIINKH